MNGGSGAHCYIVLGRNTMNGGHRETEKLTARSTAMVAASEKAPTAWVDGGGGKREKEHAGEVESEENKTEIENGRCNTSGVLNTKTGHVIICIAKHVVILRALICIH